MDFLGWYSTGDRPTLADIDIHRQITDINESPLFLQLSPGWFLGFESAVSMLPIFLL
jgi:hypothetical protein